jgi:TIR domain
MNSKAKVFISYSRRDAAFADRLAAGLKQRGFEPLIDRTEIYVFEDWWQRIQNLIIEADAVVFVSPDSVSSRICKREVEFAASRHKRLAPLELRPVDTSIIPHALERVNFELFEDVAMFERNVDRLAEALQVDLSWIRKHTHFGEQAHSWTAAGRPRALLLRSSILDEAEHWIAARPPNAPMPTPEIKAYIAESRRVASRHREIVIASLTAGLMVALGLAGLALSESARARQALDKAEHLATSLQSFSDGCSRQYSLAGPASVAAVNLNE